MVNNDDIGSQESSKFEKPMWYLDNGCSRHMIGKKKRFIKFQRRKQRFVIYGDNNKGKILRTCDIGGEENLTIKNVLFVEGLKQNLRSINQL